MDFTKLLDKSSNQTELKDLLYAAFFFKAKDEDTRTWKRLSDKGIFSKVFSKFEHSNTGYGFYCFSNDSDKTIEVTLTMTKQENVHFCKKLFFKEIFLIFLSSDSSNKRP